MTEGDVGQLLPDPRRPRARVRLHDPADHPGDVPDTGAPTTSSDTAQRDAVARALGGDVLGMRERQVDEAEAERPQGVGAHEQAANSTA